MIIKHTNNFNLYQLSIDPPHIITDPMSGETVYHPKPIGNFMWLTNIKTTESSFGFVDYDYYNQYGGSDRVFESATDLREDLKDVHLLLTSRVSKLFVSIPYHTQFGEFLQIVWWYKDYHRVGVYNVRLVWTEGDVWLGQLILPYYSEIEYHYEVCVDHGGPIIRIEDTTRLLKLGRHESCSNDLWNINFYAKTLQL